MKEMLKPCPFCGNEIFKVERAYIHEEDVLEISGFYVICLNCLARGCEMRTAEEAKISWNARFSEPQKHINEIKAQGIEEAVKKADNETYIGVIGGDFPPQKQYRIELLCIAEQLKHDKH